MGTVPHNEKDQLGCVLKDFAKGIPVSRLRHKYNLRKEALLKYLIEARALGLLGESALAKIRVSKIQYPFPEDLEERLKAVLRCMNTELKQATLLTCETYPRTYKEISKNLGALTNAKLPKAQSFASYCICTLLPAGLLVHERFGRGLGVAHRYFRLSEDGEEYGRPIAAFSLKYAVDHGISLYQLLGQSQSTSDSRSSYNRARIVELVSVGNTRLKDLMDHLSLMVEDVRQHLRHLKTVGVLTFDSLSPEFKGLKIYTWRSGRLPSEARNVVERGKLTAAVAKWLYENGSGERNQIAADLNYKDIQGISRVLVGLAAQGLADTPFLPHEKSRIVLLEKAEVVTDYLRSVRDALSGKPALDDMKTTLREFDRNKETLANYLDAGIKLYDAVSPQIHARVAEEREFELMQFIEGYKARRGLGARPVDAARALGWTHGTVTRCLGVLLRRGLVVNEKRGPAARYTVCPGSLARDSTVPHPNG